MTETDTVTGTFVPVFNHVQTWTFHAITEEHIEYFKNGKCKKYISVLMS